MILITLALFVAGCGGATNGTAKQINSITESLDAKSINELSYSVPMDDLESSFKDKDNYKREGHFIYYSSKDAFGIKGLNVDVGVGSNDNYQFDGISYDLKPTSESNADVEDEIIDILTKEYGEPKSMAGLFYGWNTSNALIELTCPLDPSEIPSLSITQKSEEHQKLYDTLFNR